MAKFYDLYSGRTFELDGGLDELKQIERDFNKEREALLANTSASDVLFIDINDFYNRVGLDPIPNDRLLGWRDYPWWRRYIHMFEVYPVASNARVSATYTLYLNYLCEV